MRDELCPGPGLRIAPRGRALGECLPDIQIRREALAKDYRARGGGHRVYEALIDPLWMPLDSCLGNAERMKSTVTRPGVAWMRL